MTATDQREWADRHRFFLVGLFAGAVYWLIESLIHAYIFTPEYSLSETLTGSHDPNELWMRALMLGMVLFVGVLADRNRLHQIRLAHYMARQNRLLSFISAIEQSLREEANEAEAMRKVCRAAVLQGGFKLAWIALKGEKHSVIAAAHAAYSDQCVKDLLADGLHRQVSCLMSLEAINSGKVASCQPLNRADCGAAMREVMMLHGAESAAAFPISVDGTVIGSLNVFASEEGFFHHDELALLEEAASDLAHVIEVMGHHQRDLQISAKIMQAADALRASLQGTVEVVGKVLETRDPYTAGHGSRVARIAQAIAEEMDLGNMQVEGIYFGALMHDIGKIAIPSEILAKPSRLGEIEYDIIKSHPVTGYEILQKVNFPWPVADVAHQHHEHMDGSGYPQGLKGEEICLEARIVAVADVAEAMSSDRPYRTGRGIEAALKEIEQGSGTKYDEAAAHACLRLFRERGFTVTDIDQGQAE